MVMRPPRPGEDDEIKLKRRPTMRIAGRGGTSVTIMQDDHHALTEEEQEDGGIYSSTSGKGQGRQTGGGGLEGSQPPLNFGWGGSTPVNPP